MSCFHPNIAHFNPHGIKDKDQNKYVLTKDGQRKYFSILGAGFLEEIDGVEYHRRVSDGKLFPKYSPYNCTSDGELEYTLLVPCQQCSGCRIDYSRKWADRIVMEQLESPPDTCYFVTLTYNDESLRDNYTGEVLDILSEGQYHTINCATLVKKDFQDFMKRLRKFYSEKLGHEGIRFFMSGEYGSTFKRPHYHVCFFNLPILDLQVYLTNFRGDILYTSPTLERIWGKGFVVIGELNWECAAYTARYVVKKFKGKDSDEFYHNLGDVLPEFSLSSRKPGIAAGYFDKHMEQIYREDAIQLPSSRDRNGRTSVPRYFDKLLEKYLENHPDCEINLEKIKAQRRELADQFTYNRRVLSGLFDREYFKLKEESFKNSFKTLNRLLD